MKILTFDTSTDVMYVTLSNDNNVEAYRISGLRAEAEEVALPLRNAVKGEQPRGGLRAEAEEVSLPLRNAVKGEKSRGGLRAEVEEVALPLRNAVKGEKSKSYNSAYLLPVIIELLQSLNLTMQDIEAIGVNIGPGSFTGIRASATVAKVMAQQLDVPVVGVSSPEIYSLLNTTDKNTLCLLDARRGKAYMAVYGQDESIILEPHAVEYEKAVEYAQNNDVFIISDNKMSEVIKEAGLECINLSKVLENMGFYLAKLTYKHLQGGNLDSFKWHNLKPLYIQPPPISMPKIK